jgi:hypothetical protein
MATNRERQRRTIKRQQVDRKRWLYLHNHVHALKAQQLMIMVERAAGITSSQRNFQLNAIGNLITKYETILTANRR